jgi:tRNA (guanine37-N1)-methyltransferase
MTIHILTIFPDFFTSPFETSIIARAQKLGKVRINIVNIRDFAITKHQTIDDRPFGGGAGMVMMVEPIDLALKSLELSKSQSQKTILTSAKGSRFTQNMAQEWSGLEDLVIVCGHYEGVDERVANYLVDEEIRIGDYVLTGGEAASLVMVDSVVRLVEGVLGNDASLQDESHGQSGYLAHAQYTKPPEYKGMKVPEVLLSGDHQAIKSWRSKSAKTVTD